MMKTDIVICVLIGLPGSGKTSLANRLVELSQSKLNFKIKIIKLSFDDLISVEDQEKLVFETKKLESCRFKDFRDKFTKLVISIICALKIGDFDVKIHPCLENLIPNQKYALVVDDNFYYKSMRHKFFRIASNYNCGFCQVYLKCSQILAKERNQNRPNQVSSEVIETMDHKLEAPCLSNSWEGESLAIPAEKILLHLQQVYDFIIGNFDKALSIATDSHSRAEAQVINMTNLLHMSDLILRTLVGQKMKSLKQSSVYSDKSLLKSASTSVNSVRQNLLSQLGDRTLLVPFTVFQVEDINLMELRLFLEAEFKLHCTV